MPARRPEPAGVAADDDDPAAALAEAAALGVPAMASLLANAQGGVIIVDGERRYVYANPAACQLLGQTLEQLRDRDLLDSFPAREHVTVLAGFVARPGRDATTFSGTLLDADGFEREVVCSTFAIDLNGHTHGVAVIWDLTGPREAARTAVALAHAAAQLVGTGTASEVLTGIARHAVEDTGALSCTITVVAEDHTLESAGAYGPRGPGYGHANPAWETLAGTPIETAIEAMTAHTIVFAEPPGPPSVVADARTIWEANPITRPFAADLEGVEWRGGVYVPVSWQNQVIGFFAICLPSTLPGPSEADLALYRALADQAAVVVMNARLTARAGTTAALLERGRLARELHDSVSQGLFSMTMHARAAQLSLAAAGVEDDGPTGRSVAQLADLTRGALAEMRALIFELRPGALTEEGLIGALRKTGAAICAREQLALTVDGPEQRLELPPEIEEHVYRIATEAVNNIVKHAHADRASVRITNPPSTLVMTVTDNGAGFDPADSHPGHLGLSTMAHRAEAIGAALTVTSTPGLGTTVELTLPLDD